MKRTSIKRYTSLKSRTPLRVKGISDIADLKQEIQDLLRQIVILRDGGCVLREYIFHDCSGFRKDGKLILQADHLITRANSATYADSRLVVCVCKGAHGWKKYHERQYDSLLKQHFLPRDRVELWDRCERDSWRPHRTSAYDWKIAIAALKQELRKLERANEQKAEGKR